MARLFRLDIVNDANFDKVSLRACIRNEIITPATKMDTPKSLVYVHISALGRIVERPAILNEA
jgi:hypothetical protein